MWASNLHLPLCLSKKGTRPEFVNSERGGGGGGHQSWGVAVWREGTEKERGGWRGPASPPAAAAASQLTASSLVK